MTTKLLPTFLLIITLFTTATWIVQLAESVEQIQVYRSLQYDKSGVELGCRRTYFSSPLSTTLPTSAPSTKRITTPITRSVLLIRLESLIVDINSDSQNTTTLVETLLTQQQEVTGIIIVLPNSLDSFSSLAPAFKQIERVLLSKTIEKPVYFTYENDAIQRIQNNIAVINRETDFIERIVGPDQYMATVAVKEATEVTPIKIVNFSGQLSGKKKGSGKATIAVVAHYDTLASVPELTNGLTSTGSSVIGLLEIARLFKILYSSASTKGNYDILFVLTGAGRLGYEGSKHWLKNLEPSIRNSIQFVLCLENIAGEGLNVHIPQKTSDENVVRLFKELTQTAKQIGVALQFSQRTPSTKEATWEHEVYNRKRIQAATISSYLKPEAQLLRTSAIDRAINQTLLERNIKIIAESLAKYIYETSKAKDVEIFSGSLGLNDQFLRSLIESLSKYSRSIPFTSPDSPITDALKTTLKQVTEGVTEEVFELSNRGFKFYSNAKVLINVYKVKPFAFDILLMVPIALYLAALHFGLKSADLQ